MQPNLHLWIFILSKTNTVVVWGVVECMTTQATTCRTFLTGESAVLSVELWHDRTQEKNTCSLTRPSNCVINKHVYGSNKVKHAFTPTILCEKIGKIFCCVNKNTPNYKPTSQWSCLSKLKATCQIYIRGALEPLLSLLNNKSHENSKL